MTILKDAAATAIYGSRAANGETATYDEVTATTAANTLVLDKGITVNTLKVKAGKDVYKRQELIHLHRYMVCFRINEGFMIFYRNTFIVKHTMLFGVFKVYLYSLSLIHILSSRGCGDTVYVTGPPGVFCPQTAIIASFYKKYSMVYNWGV